MCSNCVSCENKKIVFRTRDANSAVKRLQADLQVWLELREKLPVNTWIEVRYEDLVGDAESTVGRITSELDHPFLEPLSANGNASSNSEVFSPTYAEVNQPVHSRSIGRWRNYSQFFEKNIMQLNKLAQQLGYAAE